MNRHLRRREFLRLVLATAAGPAPWAASAASAQPRPGPDARGLTAYQVGPHVWIRWNNHLLTSYRAHRSQKYPYMYPLAGPASGLSLTTETSLPYPHHRSLLFACDHVNGGNYWQAGFEAGQILSGGPKLVEQTADSARISDVCVWKKPHGPIVCRDERSITVTVPGPRLRLIDWHIRWIAVEDLTVTRTNHSLFAVRAAIDLTPFGGGVLIDSEGRSGEAATFGKPAAWCGYHGPRRSIPGEVVEGVAVLDHPENPWAPCPWFTRDYGFISPTPMNFIPQPWRLAAGRSVTLRYRVVLHAGDHKDAALDDIHKAWTGA